MSTKKLVQQAKKKIFKKFNVKEQDRVAFFQCFSVGSLQKLLKDFYVIWVVHVHTLCKKFQLNIKAIEQKHLACSRKNKV